jgi:FMN-dependent NADH-azoreductase
MRLLHIDSSILGDGSVTRRLSAAIVADQRATHPGIEIDRLDLATDPLPHFAAPDLANGGAATASDPLERFLVADVVVLGAPMYNFTVPSQLKAWVDRILIVNRTFSYTADGPQGLAGGKRVFVATASGGYYGADSPFRAAEHVRSYLAAVFGFIGISDVSFVAAEGLQAGVEDRDDIVAAALAQVERIAA